jgi:hypothetical protein
MHFAFGSTREKHKRLLLGRSGFQEEKIHTKIIELKAELEKVEHE